jgi:peptidoglycan/LPS O-acetylase OafA/YrhL
VGSERSEGVVREQPETSGLLGVLFYVANWVNIYRPKALGITADTWSLAIEEQFYLLWPIVLVLFLRRRVRTATIAAVTLVGLAASAAWGAYCWYHRFGTRPADDFTAFIRGFGRLGVWNRIYFGSDTARARCSRAVSRQSSCSR